MKILYFTDAMAVWGGIERILVEKMNYLADMYHYEVHMITYNQGTHPVPFPLSEKVHFQDLGILSYRQYRYKGLKKLLVRHKLSRLLRSRLKSYICQTKPDVIICIRPFLLGPVLRAKSDARVVIESHSSCEQYRYELESPIKIFMAKRNLRKTAKAQHIVALTNGDANDWRRINPNVSVIPNIVHLNENGVYSDCSTKSAIFVGRFSKQKDIGILIDIWRIIHVKHPDWELHIYGGYGEQYDSLHPLLENSSLNIIVHEPTADIFTEYINSSMLLLTSTYEPFGLVLPEAMSCGLPVVSFDCPYGPADIITDSIDGFLIPNRNIDEFAEKVCLLMSDEQLRKKMGNAGIKSSQRYKDSLIMPMWDRLFKQITK